MVAKSDTKDLLIKRKGNHFLNEFAKNFPLFTMLIPGAVLFLIFNYLPLPLGFIYAFCDVRVGPDLIKNIMASKWVGFKNFEYFVVTPDAFIITRNTILYNAAFIFLGIVISVAVAIALNELRQRRAARLYQGIMFLPYFFSWVVVSYLAFSLFSMDLGFINKGLFPLIGQQSISWYTEKGYWPYIIIFVNLWRYLGYNSVIYLAAIVGINTDYYEAARIDGANKWKQIRFITIPLLTPTITILALLGVSKIFNAEFGLFYQVPLNNGALFDVTNVMDTFVYRSFIQMGDIGMSAAAGFYQAIVGFIVVLASNFAIRKVDPEMSLF